MKIWDSVYIFTLDKVEKGGTLGSQVFNIEYFTRKCDKTWDYRSSKKVNQKVRVRKK